MAYDIFSQLQGPQIDTNLFANSATAGINAGKAMPSPVTAVIQGVTEGIETGQRIYGNYQNTQIRQHQIDQFPIEDARRQAQLDNEIAIAEINKNKAEIDALNQATEREISVQKSKNELEAAKQTAASTEAQKRISDTLANPDPNAQLEVMNDPLMRAELARNPKLADQVAGRINANPAATEKQKEELVGVIGYHEQKEMEFKQKELDARETNELNKKMEAINTNYRLDNELKAARALSGLTNEEFLRQTSIFPSGRTGGLNAEPTYYVYAGEGKNKKLVLDKRGAPVELHGKSNENFSAKQDLWRRNGAIEPEETPFVPPDDVDDTKLKKPNWAERTYNSLLGEEATPADKPVGSTLLGGANAGTPAPQATPTGEAPQAGPAGATAPAGSSDSAGKVLMNSTDAISQQAAGRAEAAAQTRPNLKSLLIRAGRMVPDAETAMPLQESAPSGPMTQGATAPAGAVDAAPETTPTASPTQTAVDVATTPAVKDEVITPPKDATEQSTWQKMAETLGRTSFTPIDYAVETTDPYVKKKNRPNAKVMHTVLTEPLLANEDPLTQAVAAVEGEGLLAPRKRGKSLSTATGPMQILAPTARGINTKFKTNLDVTVPAQNIQMGKKLLGSLLERYDNAETPAVMAYYFGEPVINRAADIAGSYEYDDLMRAIRYLHKQGYFEETLTSGNIDVGEDYPKKVLAYKAAFAKIPNGYTPPPKSAKNA